MPASAILLALQAATGGVIDLKPLVRSCDGSPDEIVVCGNRSDKYRIAPMPPSEKGLPPAQFHLFGKVPTQFSVQQQDINGAVSQRAMVTFRLHF